MDIEDVARGRVSLRHVAALAACLPAGSLALGREDERLGWSREQILLLAVANSLREEPIDPFAEPSVREFDPDALGEYLSLPRVAAEGGDA